MLTPKDRKTLLARSHALKPAVTCAADRLSPAVVDQVRAAFPNSGLLKVRISADDAATCDAAAASLAAEVPCEIVRRVGRIVILFRPSEDPAAP